MRAHGSYRHEALLYRGATDFLTQSRAFVQDGLDLGQPVLVAVAPPRLDLLRSAFSDTDAVLWVDMSELGANPARIIAAWRAFLDDHGGGHRPVRGLGEPIWAGRRAAEVAEAQLHEALLNLAIEPDTPLWLRCPYDLDTLPTQVIDEASRSHPALVHAGNYSGSLSYGGAEYATAKFTEDLPAPPGAVPALPFTQDTLGGVRSAVMDTAASLRLAPARGAALAVAVGEAAANSVRHGGGRGVLRSWEQDGALVCEIRDGGLISDPLVGRRQPSPNAPDGRGLWLVNQLSDLAQVRSNHHGTVVRVITRLRPADQPVTPDPPQPQPTHQLAEHSTGG